MFLYTLRRAALAGRATTTYNIQQLCPINDCNGKRELVTRTYVGQYSRAELQLRAIYQVPQLCPM